MTDLSQNLHHMRIQCVRHDRIPFWLRLFVCLEAGIWVFQRLYRGLRMRQNLYSRSEYVLGPEAWAGKRPWIAAQGDRVYSAVVITLGEGPSSASGSGGSHFPQRVEKDRV